MHGWLRALAVLGVGVVASACGNASTVDGSSPTGDRLRQALVDRTFLSESVEGWALVTGTQVTITFRGSRLGASAGCNHIGGSYSIDGDRLSMGTTEITEMGCGPGQHDQDQWLVGFLRAGPTLALSEPRLVMTTSDASMTLIDREVAIPDRPLVGTQWRGEALGDGTAVSTFPGVELIGIVFQADGSVAIATGCETGNGSYTVDGDTISFAQLVYGAPCADPNYARLGDQVRIVLDGSPILFSIDGQSLTLMNGSNELFFRSAE